MSVKPHTCGRADPAPQTVQAGWDWVYLGDKYAPQVVVTKVPRMIQIPWAFNHNIKCGYANRASDAACSGCRYQNWVPDESK